MALLKKKDWVEATKELNKKGAGIKFQSNDVIEQLAANICGVFGHSVNGLNKKEKMTVANLSFDKWVSSGKKDLTPVGVEVPESPEENAPVNGGATGRGAKKTADEKREVVLSETPIHEPEPEPLAADTFENLVVNNDAGKGSKFEEDDFVYHVSNPKIIFPYRHIVHSSIVTDLRPFEAGDHDAVPEGFADGELVHHKDNAIVIFTYRSHLHKHIAEDLMRFEGVIQPTQQMAYVSDNRDTAVAPPKQQVVLPVETFSDDVQMVQRPSGNAQTQTVVNAPVVGLTPKNIADFRREMLGRVHTEVEMQRTAMTMFGIADVKIQKANKRQAAVLVNDIRIPEEGFFTIRS